MDTELPVKRRPIAPVCVVNEHQLALQDNSLAWRNKVLIPLLLALMFLAAWHVNTCYEHWQLMQANILADVDDAAIKRDGEYFLKTDKVDDIDIYYRVDVQQEASIERWLDLRYQQQIPLNWGFGNISWLWLDAVVLPLLLLGIPILIYTILNFRLNAPIFFDRSQLLVYTWRKGKVWAEKYESLKFTSNANRLTLYLHTFDGLGDTQIKTYSLQPSGSLLINGKVAYTPALTAVCQFMRRGMDRVWPERWQDDNMLWVRRDSVPKDLHQQIEALQSKLA